MQQKRTRNKRKRRAIRADYFFIIVLILLASIMFYKELTKNEIDNTGAKGIAKVISIKHIYKQGLVIVYEYTYNGKKYLNRKSVGSRDEAKEYLDKFYEIRILDKSPDKSLIYLNKEVIR